MSLYLGKTSIGGVLHVTSDTQSSSALQNGILPSTVFHSKLPYVGFIGKYTVTINSNAAYAGYSIRGLGEAYVGLITATIPSNLFPYFNSDYMVFVACKSVNSGGNYVISRVTAQSYYSPSYYNNYSYYSVTSRTFLPSPNVPIGGDYYNTSYANTNALQTSFTASSSSPYLLLSFNSGSAASPGIFLQTYGGASQLDAVNSTGYLYIFKLSKGNPVIGNSYGCSVLLNKNQFIINGNNTSLDMTDYSFISSVNPSSGDVKFSDNQCRNIVNGLSIYNQDKIPATGWSISMGNSFSVVKHTATGDIPIINSSINYTKLVNTLNIPVSIYHSGDYSNSSISSWSGSYSFFVVLAHIDSVMNGVTVSIPSHFYIGFPSDNNESQLCHVAASMTNYQGGTTSRHNIISVNANSSLIDIKYQSYLSGNPYPIDSNTTGNIIVYVFN